MITQASQRKEPNDILQISIMLIGILTETCVPDPDPI